MISPVNASRLPSRTIAHHSGPKPLAKRYSAEDLHLLSFASFPGARGSGSGRESSTLPRSAGNAPESGRLNEAPAPAAAGVC